MFRLNLQRIQGYFISSCKLSLRRRSLQFMARQSQQHWKRESFEASAAGGGGNCALWKRLVSQYQFRTKKEPYYPNRQTEIRRQGVKPMTVMKPQVQHRGLPKDYYYKVLGVNRHATIQQIRSAFYALAKRYHPDSTHSEEKLKHFQELSNAYNILTDETKRLEYDQLGGIKDEQAFLEQAGNPMNLERTGRKMDVNTHSSDDIKKLTGNEFDLPLNFVEATVGCKKRLDLRYLRKCDSCKGKSQLMVNRDVGKEPCRRCNGTGKVTTKTPTFTSVNTCSQCKGKRYINRNDCETCDNRGFIVANVEVLVTVPSGSKCGDVITIENPNTKQRVNYHLKVPSSDYFRRIGNDIYTDKYLNISDAILGGTFQVRGLYEDVELRVEAGTQSHTQVVLRNKGVRTRDEVGNHIITLKVRIPLNLSVKQRQLVLALAQAEEPVFECQNKTVRCN
ncbi:dnaJ homolog subfamily A member 3, mitochondrial [Drosophila sulfurigaster albostrigata]|uniref:dnaJ homolog subfamily A member 3, mitochondrial n=1 Tax=Drosophila sulfurigaster albostrigata TaxID=89887 RepID=UPI002D21AA73|nr:dnaJ homolog subfamily A member 3, mitochondrial [Drosophila sulfurigaster albostrigata]